MKISKKLYVDEGVPYHRRVIWKLRRDKKAPNMYCIIYTQNNFLEIINSNKIKDDHTESLLIGIATTRRRAMELVARIFQDVYVPNPDIKEMKNYFAGSSK